MLLIRCRLMLSLCGFTFVQYFVVLCIVSFFARNHLDGEQRAGCFTLFVLLVSCNCYYLVALPHGAMS